VLEEITKEVFYAHGIERSTDNRFQEIFLEKRWFRSGKFLGVILFDHDGLWGWVVLVKHVDRGYAGIDIGYNLKTCEDAIRTMVDSFQENADIGPESLGGPAATASQVVKIAASASGMTEEQAWATVESLKKPRPGNN
jgi:hypothetical protein